MSRTTALSQPIELHKVLEDWGEGTSKPSANEGGGAPSTTGDATWVHRSLNISDDWKAIGGSFTTAVSASLLVEEERKYTWDTTDRMVADVQEWLDDPSTNFGWLLLGNENTNRTTKRFDSKENNVELNRPVLVVTFIMPG